MHVWMIIEEDLDGRRNATDTVSTILFASLDREKAIKWLQDFMQELKDGEDEIELLPADELGEEWWDGDEGSYFIVLRGFELS